MDHLPVRQIIETYGTSAVAVAMGISVSTLHGWKMANAIPGKGPLHELRVQAFLKAVKSLQKASRRRPKTVKRLLPQQDAA
jgi:hypothetical protein